LLILVSVSGVNRVPNWLCGWLIGAYRWRISPENAADCGMPASAGGSALVSQFRIIIEKDAGRRKRQSQDFKRKDLKTSARFVPPQFIGKPFWTGIGFVPASNNRRSHNVPYQYAN
jgi:hypothetical protein